MGLLVKCLKRLGLSPDEPQFQWEERIKEKESDSTKSQDSGKSSLKKLDKERLFQILSLKRKMQRVKEFA